MSGNLLDGTELFGVGVVVFAQDHLPEAAAPREGDAGLLRAFLEHKRMFLLLPAGLVLSGLMIWLGFERIFGWLPATVRTSWPASAVSAGCWRPAAGC